MSNDEAKRTSLISRKTGETDIFLELDLDGSGESDISSGVGFLDHMLNLLAWHSGCDLKVKVEGDLNVDAHHTIEDVGISLGLALAEAVGDKRGIERYGYFLLPMDETLVAAALDLSGRFYYLSDYVPIRDNLGEMPTDMVNHFFYSLACEARMSLHFKFMNQGENEHHKVEAMFKAFGRALKQAVSINSTKNSGKIPSTKGTL
ncbi:MAG: imidazoleglycerol-phosphate dehydratase HisB [Anaerolineales bacterium]|nr:imidazoleglycerol-phosphate dehydratase HisB [Anaerolineales bacterium]